MYIVYGSEVHRSWVPSCWVTAFSMVMPMSVDSLCRGSCYPSCA